MKSADQVRELHEKAVPLMKEGKWAEAAEIYEQAVNISPFMPAILINLSNCWDKLGYWGRAINALERALSMEPNLPEGYVNLSAIYHKMDHTASALAASDKALSLDPFNKGHRWNRAVYNLSLGNLKQGWTDYDARYWRPFARDVRRPEPPPYWHGAPFPPGAIVHVWAEQGLGEVILYTQMVRDLATLTDGAGQPVRVLYEIPDGLKEIVAFSLSEYQNIMVIGHNTKHDIKPTLQLPTGNLGKIFRREWSQFSRRPYIKIPKPHVPNSVGVSFGNDGRISFSKSTSSALPKKVRIGLSWHSINDEIGRGKSMGLIDLKDILAIPDVELVNLQYGDVKQEVEDVCKELGVTIDLEDDDYRCVNNNKDMMPWFRRVDSCDYVVTISNFTAHAAASMGKRTLIMLPRGQSCLWHWFKIRNDSPWYETAILYRQQLPPHHGRPWFEDVVPIVAQDLRRNLMKETAA